MFNRTVNLASIYLRDKSSSEGAIVHRSFRSLWITSTALQRHLFGVKVALWDSGWDDVIRYDRNAYSKYLPRASAKGGIWTRTLEFCGQLVHARQVVQYLGTVRCWFVVLRPDFCQREGHFVNFLFCYIYRFSYFLRASVIADKSQRMMQQK